MNKHFKQTTTQNTRDRCINTENEQVAARGEKVRGWVNQVKGFKKYKLPVIKQISCGNEAIEI